MPTQTTTTLPDPQATALARARYDRIAPFYDLLEVLAERRYSPWRRAFWEEVLRHLPAGSRLLEVGLGTGKNMPYWPREARLTAVDLSPRMLERARRKAARLGLPADLRLGDAQALPFPDNAFDAAVATFVFCSVPDPVQGLRELRRVVRPGGFVLLMEHVRSPNPLLGRLMDLLNPLVVRITGANINRDTVENVRRAGLAVEEVVDLGAGGIFKRIRARVPGEPSEGERR